MICDISPVSLFPNQSVDQVMERQKVWVPQVEEGFILGHIVDLGTEEVTVQPRDKRFKPITCPFERVYPAEEDEGKDVDDNCKVYAFCWI